MDIVALLSAASHLPSPEAAALYAAAGVPVFPCVPGENPTGVYRREFTVPRGWRRRRLVLVGPPR